MAKKKTKVDLTEKEAAEIARVAHAAQREADLLDQIENKADDFTVQVWEFVLPREKAEATKIVQAMASGEGFEPKFYKPGDVFDTVAKALL